MYIGFTERGDAGIDTSWQDKLKSSQGAVLITKFITDRFKNAIGKLVENDFPFIIHATVTGWGGTKFEPCVPDYKTELNSLYDLIKAYDIGNKIVLRIDPIFPTEKGLQHVGEVLEYAKQIGLLPCRVRISIYDEYPHVRERLAKIGKEPLYKGKFYAPAVMMDYASEKLSEYAKRYNIIFETCAEPYLTNGKNNAAFKETGCLSIDDIKIMGLPTDEAEKAAINRQQRGGCKCLGIKYELLSKRQPCPNGCLYCYWKDPINN